MDKVLGGGLRGGRLTVVYGKGNSGKSQIAMQAALCAANGGHSCLYIDTEGAFRPERVLEMARARGLPGEQALGRIVYLRCSSAAEQADATRRLQSRESTAGCRLVVVDTLTKNFSLDLPGSENLPGRQGALDAHLSEMARDAYLNGRAYLLSNRVTFDRQGADVGIGGSTVSQLVHTTLHLQREGRLIRVSEDGGTGSTIVGIGPAGIGVGNLQDRDAGPAPR